MAPLTDQQKAERAFSLGASEFAAAVGLNPFCDPTTMWQIKRGLIAFEDTEKTKLGHYLEPAIATAAADRLGLTLLPSPGTVKHGVESWVSCTPDYEIEGGGCLECKNVGVHVMHHWGLDLSDDVPDYVRCQATIQMFVRGHQHAIVAALVAGDLRTYRLAFNENFCNALIEAGREFWGHVQRGEPPPIDGTEGATRYLLAKYERNGRPMIPATDEAGEWAERLFSARESVDRFEQEAELCKQGLMIQIGDADGIFGDGWRVTWKADKNGTRVFRPTKLKQRKAA